MKRILQYIVLTMLFLGTVSEAKSLDFSHERKIYRNAAGRSSKTASSDVNSRAGKLKKIPDSYKSVPTKLRGNKPGTIDLSKFTQKLEKGLWKNPKTGYTISRDTSNHGGSLWKLNNKDGNRIGSITSTGTYLRK